MMTVQEFMEMFIDPDTQHIQIWSDAEEKIVSDGDYGDIPENMDYAEVTSIDNIYKRKSFDGIILNIDR